MAKKKTKSGQKSPAGTQTTSPIGVSPTFTPQGMPTPPQPPPISPEVRDELTVIFQELLVRTHELSFEYSTLDCEDVRDCPLAQKSKELFKVVKKLRQLMSKVAPPRKTSMIA